ncbi:MAG: hypothetical protein WD873_08855, partial [Candidatus Hydrogenedentales bacterium]
MMGVSRTWAAFILVPAISALGVIAPAANAQQAEHPRDRRPSLPLRKFISDAVLKSATPRSPNPYLSLLPPNVEPDWAYWHAKMRMEAATQPPSPAVKGIIVEAEPNDSGAAANFLSGFGTGNGDSAEADVFGNIPSPSAPLFGGVSTEDDGAIPLANTVTVSPGQARRVSGNIGDGPFGGTFGDFDFYELQGITMGQLLTFDVDTPFGNLDSFITVWSADGDFLDANDDDFFSLDSFLQFTAPISGTYYVSVGAFLSPFPNDPFDSSSGEGPGETGPYQLTIGVDRVNPDFFSIDLEAGDVLGVAVNDAADHVSLFDPSGALRVATSLSVGFIFPQPSPLPRDGYAMIAYLIETTGRYTVRVVGSFSGGYVAQFRVFRPSLESAPPGV